MRTFDNSGILQEGAQQGGTGMFVVHEDNEPIPLFSPPRRVISMSVSTAQTSTASTKSTALLDHTAMLLAEAAPVKILIVDDHPENLLALEATLDHSGTGPNGTGRNGAGRNGSQESLNVEFIRATSGREALRKVLLENYAVILLDVQMPEMDGYETAELIRKRPQSQFTPIIFLTAVNTSEVNIFRGYSLGAVDYITKPFDPWVLRAKVGVFVELYRKQLEIERQAALLRSSNTELEGKSEELRMLNEDLERRVSERTQELETANQELWKAKETAEFANSAKDKFLAVLSHELRTPLTPVLAIVQMLDEDPKVTSEVKSWVETIGRNVQLEARLIDDLLDLTRITNGKLELHAGAVDVHKLIHDTVDICGDEIRAKDIQLSLSLDAWQSIIEVDPARLHQVLWNLLKNAVKFTPEHGSISIRTLNTTEGRHSMLRCEITDTGIGIPPEYLKSVFNAFDQGGKTITRRFGGLGLGLAISKALVEQHHGAIWAESDGLEKGATFTIEIPTAAISKLPPSEKTPATGSPLIAAARILLVEDNEDTSRAMQVLFERKGFKVEVANSVASAMELSKTHPIDLVISDIGLPDGDGFEVIRRLNEIRPTRGIAISGFGMEEDRRRSLEAGFHAHLVKPVNFAELSGIAQKLLAEL
ncbi:MAG TPA: response regulator [Candidatus Kapabacteria bacterium]|nr:response regulator [Candidatus Kapabacteria bacterium]